MKKKAKFGAGAGAPLVAPALVVGGEGMESVAVPDPLKTGLEVVTAGAGPAGAPGGGSCESNLHDLGVQRHWQRVWCTVVVPKMIILLSPHSLRILLQSCKL